MTTPILVLQVPFDLKPDMFNGQKVGKRVREARPLLVVSSSSIIVTSFSLARSKSGADSDLTASDLALQVRLYSHNTKFPHPPIFKIGQLRMYTRGLEEKDLLYLMSSAKWPNGKSVQQCVSSVSIHCPPTL